MSWRHTFRLSEFFGNLARGCVRRPSQRVIAVLVLMAAGGFLVTLQARGASASATSLLVSPTDDTYASKSAQKTNYGRNPSLFINHSSTATAITYLRFNVTGIPAGAVINSATLHLTATNSSGDVAKLKAVSLSSNWTEDSLTWSNKPAYTSTTSLVSTPAKVLAGPVTFDVSSLVSGNGGVGFGVYQAGTPAADQSFSSKEGTAPPRLEIVFSPSPSPSPTVSPSPSPVLQGGIYGMDEGPGATTMVDSSGYGNNGTITGSVDTGASGRTGRSMDYAYGFALPGGIVNVPDSPTLNPGARPISIDLWVMTPGPVGDWNLLQKGLNATTGGQYKVEIHPILNGSQGVPACIFKGVTSAGTVTGLVTGTKNVVDGSWHKVTCRYDGTTITESVDGTVDQTKSVAAGTISNAAVLAIGAKPKGTGADQYVGLIDDVTISIG